MIRSAELVGKHVRVFAQQGAIRGVHDPCPIAAEGTYDLFSTGPGPTRPEYKWLDQGAVICSDRRTHWGDQFAADDRCSSRVREVVVSSPSSSFSRAKGSTGLTM